ncbi:MAG: hypothetical protein UU76_C0009G0009 [Parcubacteria group bacterium GW2011_GWC1_41_7]|nr:MAG: hypothetical protein UU76_C0009G0009 [Parcubacteria group bacterium GW2011_GWC1_41_7]
MQEEYDRLLNFFKEHGKFLSEEDQETWYLQSNKREAISDKQKENDVRIQRGIASAKIWMKKGVVHDEAREEIEIPINPKDFNKIVIFFEELDCRPYIKWFRKRITFLWDGITVCLDNTRGYGMILELEKMADDEQREEILTFLKEKMKELGVSLTPREEFEKKYHYYKENWERLTE